MPKSSPIQSDFRGGEIGPFFQGRVESPVYRRGLDTCLNWIPLIQGGVTRRPGTKYVGKVKTSANYTRLIPFIVSSTTAYVLEVGALYIRIWNSDGTAVGAPTELVTPYTQGELRALKFVQHNDNLANYLYITHPAHPLAFVTNSAGTFWGYSVATLYDGPYMDVDPTLTTFNVTAVSGPGVATLLASSIAGINGGLGFQTTDVGRHVRIYRTDTQNVPNATVITTVVPVNTVPGFPPGFQLPRTQVSTAPAAGVGVVTQQVVTWGIITTRNSTTEVLVTPSSGSPFLAGVPNRVILGLFCATNGYPACVAVHEGRLFLGGVPGQGKRIDGSYVQAFAIFSPTDLGTLQPTDANAVSFNLYSEDSNNIQWMKSQEHGLLCGTQGDEWTVRPSVVDQALSPTNISAKVTTTYGSASVDPVKVGKNTVFVQRYGKKVRELIYDFYVNGYKAPDRTLHAEHIAGATGFVEMAYQKGPQSIIWCVRADGLVAGMTHEEEEGEIVVGWHRHRLGANLGALGAAESVACIPSSDSTRDVVWFAVNRTIGGSTVRTLEKMEDIFTQFTVLDEAFYLDCGQRTFVFPATTTMSPGVTFNGEMLTVWGDGKPIGTVVVAAGAVTFPQALSTRIVGYPYDSDLVTLRYESGSANGGALTKIKRAHRLGMLLYQALCVKIGTSFGALTEMFFRDSTIPNGTPTPLFSGVRLETIDADYDFDNKYCLRVSQPCPATVLALQPRMDTQDGE